MSLTHSLSRLWKSDGGLQLDGHKAISNQEPVIRAQLPPYLILPLQQHIGASAKPVVMPGEKVLKGQLLARTDGYVSAALHAPSSGTLVALEERPIAHPSGLSAPCLVLETDGQDSWGPLLPPLANYLALDPADIRKRIRESGIVGLGGAAFPTTVKLNAGSTGIIQLLILNAAECEPYITCDDRLMRDRAEEVIGGLLIMRHALQAREVLIGIEDDKPEAWQALKDALAEVGHQADGVAIRRIPTSYPSGGERQLIRILTGREVPSHGIPPEIGIVCQNVGTAVAAYGAVMERRPLISRYITITGAGVQHPRVLEALIGTPIDALIDQCGGYTHRMERLIMGGPMMGFTLPTDSVPITKGSNCILAAGQEELVPPQPAMPCIRCGACMEVCPARLLPQQLYWYARSRDFDKVQDYHLFDCIECGCCAAVCPSHIPLVHYYRFAKTTIWAQERERHKADHARQRHEAHLARLEREKEQKSAKLRQKKQALDQPRPASQEKDPKKAVIEAAVARARARKTAVTRTDSMPASPSPDKDHHKSAGRDRDT